MPRTGRSTLTALLFLLAVSLLPVSGARGEGFDYYPYPGAGWESRIGKKLDIHDGIRVTVPLDFNYFGRRFTSAWISDDGYLQFPDGETREPSGPQDVYSLPVPYQGYAFLIAPFWSALDPASGGVYFNTLGSPPARTYVVTWLDLPSSEDPEAIGPSSFQVVLREATGEIEFNYRGLDWDNNWWVAGLNLGDGAWGVDASGEVAAGTSRGYRPASLALAYPSSTRVRERDRVTFDGSRSHLEGESIDAYQWDFGTDAEPSLDAVGRRVTTRYAREGIYTATLTVVGSQGTLRQDEARITVLGRAPMARIQVVTSPVQYRRALVLSGAPSSDDRGIRSYRWDFGDGASGHGPWVSHRYETSGSFTVKLTVEDAAGQTSTATARIGVAPGSKLPSRLLAGGTGPGLVYERLEGQGWETISPPLGRGVTDLAELDGVLYASAWDWAPDGYGAATSTVYRRPLGAGAAWEPVGRSFPYLVTALEVYRGRLYLGAAEAAEAVQVLDRAADDWVVVHDTFVGVYSMKVIDDRLYIGDYDTDHISRWDGEVFSTVMQFDGSCIWDIEGWNDSIFAAAYGNMYYVSDEGGNAWQLVSEAGGPNDWTREMWALQSYQGRLYGGVDRGGYTLADMDPKAALVVLDEESRTFAPVVSFDAASDREGVLELATDGRCLYLGLGLEAQWYRTEEDIPARGAVWEYCGANAVDLSPPGGMGRGVAALSVGLAVDGTPPVVESFTLSPSVLPKAHHRMVEIKPTFTANDPGGGALTFKLLKIDYRDFGGFDRTCYDGVEGLRCNGPAFRDISVDSRGKIWLRAERDSRGTGRVYTVTGVVLDEAGNASAPASATVTVPRTR